MHTNEGRDLIRRKLIILLCMRRRPDYIKYYSQTSTTMYWQGRCGQIFLAQEERPKLRTIGTGSQRNGNKNRLTGKDFVSKRHTTTNVMISALLPNFLCEGEQLWDICIIIIIFIHFRTSSISVVVLYIFYFPHPHCTYIGYCFVEKR